VKLGPIIGVALAVPLLFPLGIAMAATAGGTFDTTACSPSTVPDSAGSAADLTSLDAAQRSHARTIYTVGVQLGVAHRGTVIALAVALQESSLINHTTATDHDSLGLFQQRPSQGWGTPAQLIDPVYASTQFYNRLLRVAGWERLPLTDAAQSVQRSAYPGAYAKWEPLATALANDAASTTGLNAVTGSCPPPCDAGTKTCWVAPVDAAVVSGFRTPERPGHDGVDLGAARATPIRAAAAGTVIIVRCDIQPASHGCNRDGSPATPGCGWYIDVLHADDIITRYCHMLIRPLVQVGQQVATGQVVGYVGSSGHSSGPHLHFEVHLNRDRSDSGAVDPFLFMGVRGIYLP
jgi:murein DD-endopeptidase MepM/ murein hydrolase activator NlpD